MEKTVVDETESVVQAVVRVSGELAGAIVEGAGTLAHEFVDGTTIVATDISEEGKKMGQDGEAAPSPVSPSAKPSAPETSVAPKA
jgi:hypothetical protein